MKEENKKCWSCAKIERYYTKGYCALQKEKVGFCSLQSKIVDKDDSCKMWNFRQRVRNIRKKMAINSIIEIRSKLDVIEQINEDKTVGELGWILNKKYQNMGYATESVLAIKNFALNVLTSQKVDRTMRL